MKESRRGNYVWTTSSSSHGQKRHAEVVEADIDGHCQREEKHRTRFPPRTDLARQVGLRGEVEQEHPEHVSDLTGAAGASAPVLSPPLAASIF